MSGGQLLWVLLSRDGHHTAGLAGHPVGGSSADRGDSHVARVPVH